jgi:hypothetical protein
VPGLPTLRPFRSFLFLRLKGAAEDNVSGVRNAIADLAPGLSGAEPLQRGPRSRKGELHTALGVYRRRRRAAWTTDDSYTDVEHHLIAVSGYKTWCAVFMSDAGLRESVRQELLEETQPFEQCELVNPNKLNAVFVNGRARTLWLNNVQRRSALKADHKVLSGTVLQELWPAISPCTSTEIRRGSNSTGTTRRSKPRTGHASKLTDGNHRCTGRPRRDGGWRTGTIRAQQWRSNMTAEVAPLGSCARVQPVGYRL